MTATLVAPDPLVEVRAALAAEPVRAALAALRRSPSGTEPDPRPLYRELGRSGLLAVDWPREYGGREGDAHEAALVVQELVRAGVPDTLHVNTIQIVGAFLLLAGTPAQCARYLPAFARGESFASVLYTEPLAGSDLAALRTTATPVHNGYRLNGVKVFSLKTHIVDIGLCAARTPDSDRYGGITLFIVDMAADGVRRSTLPSIADEQFHRVELHDVVVPADAVVGEVGGGWELIGKALAIERTGLDYLLKAERWLALAAGGPDPSLATDVGRYRARVAASCALTWRVLRHSDVGPTAEATAAAAKWYASELARDVALWAARVHGLGYAARGLSEDAVRELEAAYREAPGLTLSAGTSEMMLRIMASTPDEPLAGLPAGRSARPPAGDGIRDRLRAALRRSLASVPLDPDPRAAPRAADVDSAAYRLLIRLRVPDLELPEELGGLGVGLPAALVVAEELGRAGIATPYLGTAVALHGLSVLVNGVPASLLAGGPASTLAALRDGSLAPIPAGFAGDAVRARPGWRLSGTALAAWPPAGSICLPIAHEGGMSLALLRLAAPTRTLPGGAALIPLDGVTIEPDDVICPLPSGSDVLAAAHLRQAAYLLGLAEGALAEATRHADRRKQFDRPLRDHQSIAFRLAECRIRLVALRALIESSAESRVGSGVGGPPAEGTLALAAETAMDVLATAMQVGGARALTGEMTLHRRYRLVRSESACFGTPDALWQRTESSRHR